MEYVDGLHEKLVLTYDNTKSTDGAGAQLQRIYGIYAISRLLGASYLHTGLGYVEYHGLSTLEADVADPSFVPDPDFHREFNELFQIESDISPDEDFHPVELHDISMEAIHELVALFDCGETSGRPILVKGVMPYPIVESVPECYQVCKEISPFETAPRDGRPLRVAIHVRRGELFVFETVRMLPNSYYIQVAQGVARALENLGVEFQLELCTEIPTKEIVVQDDHHGILGRAGRPVIINADMSQLEEFDVLPNLVSCINESTLETFRRFATADILIMSRSSLSYICGILNRSCVVLFHPFWHGPLAGWIPVEPDGAFDEAELRRALQGL